MMLFLSLVIYLVFSYIVFRSHFKELGLADFAITFFLSVFSINVITGEVLSLLNRLNQPVAFLLLQFAICALLAGYLFLTKRIDLDSLLKKPSRWLPKGDSLAKIFGILMILAFACFFFIGITTPPNNLDSLHTHLARIYYWIQHGNMNFWPAVDINQLNYPINANLQGLWLFLLGRNENLFFLVSWFSLVIICITVFKIGQRLHLTTHQALFSSLIVLSMPIALLQTYSFQNDLPVTALLLIFIYLFLSYRESSNQSHLFLAILSLTLSLAVKQTAFLVLPAIGLYVLYLFIKKAIDKKSLLTFGLILPLFFIFASYTYIQNEINLHSFFGTEDVTGDQPLSLSYIADKASYNIPRYLYNFLSTDGLPSGPSNQLIAVKGQLFDSVFTKLGINLEDTVYLQPGYDKSEEFHFLTPVTLTEDTAWFGPICILLCLVSFFLVLFQKDKLRKEYLIFTFVLFWSYLAAIFLQRPGWDPYQGRYFILSILPALPLVGVCFIDRKTIRPIEATVFSLAFLLIFANTFLFNFSKPIITAGKITGWQNKYLTNLPFETRLQKYVKNKSFTYSNQLIKVLPKQKAIFQAHYYEQLFYSSADFVPDIEMVNAHMADRQPLYARISKLAFEYALFGKNQTRALYPIEDFNQVPAGSYLLVQNIWPQPKTGFDLIANDGRFTLYQKN
jgi:4-amino-4-deoxy-L-arabinose transferase and related glycosyltransferases of PMT family